MIKQKHFVWEKKCHTLFSVDARWALARVLNHFNGWKTLNKSKIKCWFITTAFNVANDRYCRFKLQLHYYYLIQKFGEVLNVAVMKKEDNKSKGFGFVSMKSHEDAQKAVEALNDTKIGGWFQNDTYQ